MPEERSSPNTRYLVPAPVRWFFVLLSRIWPAQAARIGARLFCTPMRGVVKPAEEPVMAAAEHFTVDVAGERLAGYAWGEGPTVLLVHGWGSRASRLTPLVEPRLLRQGRTGGSRAGGRTARDRHPLDGRLGRLAGPAAGLKD